MPASGAGSDVFSVLRRISTARPVAAGQRCEMCSEPIDDGHPHVVDLESRGLLCTCRPCYLLFTDESAALRYRAIPDRYATLDEVELGQGVWDELEIPIGMAFFFFNSRLGRTVVFYPGPAGATESELPLGAWETLVEQYPSLASAAADTEAVLIRMEPDAGAAECYIVPIDACYELVGRLRSSWRGFDGGSDARAELDAFFGKVRRLSRPVRTERQHG